MRAEPNPLSTLFGASLAAAVAMAVINVAVLVARAEVALLRDLDLLHMTLGAAGAPRSAFTGRLIAALPDILNHNFPLHEVRSLAVFTALSVALTLLIFWAAAALAAPLVVLAARLSSPADTEPTSRWFWTRGYPLGLLVAFGMVGLLRPVHRLLDAWGEPVTYSVAAAVAAILWLLLLVTFRRPGVADRFIRRASVVAMIVGLTASAAGGLAFTVGAERHARQAPPLRAPNILLVSIDSLRPDHVHCYGYARDTSPTIDALGREGAMFRTVVSPTSWTLPAHLTLLTALPPEKHGVVDDETRLHDETVSLAEVLRRAGYTTAGFVSAPYLDALYGFSQGFDHYDDYTIAKRSFDDSHSGVTSPALLRIFSEWIEQWNTERRKRPFFVFLHMWDPHYDYEPPPPYDSMFDPSYTGSISPKNYLYNPAVHAGMDARDLAHLIALYDGEVRFTDLHLGYVLDELRRLGVLDDTLVVVTADHGDEFFEHGQKGHKKTLYDESILVPLVIRYPAKVPAGRVVEDQVRLMDIAPTILALAGVTRPPDFGPTGLQGVEAPQDLSPWIMAAGSATLPKLPAFSDVVGEAPIPLAAVRTQDSKFIKEQRGPGREELYDLAHDPGEQANLLHGGEPVDTPLRRHLATWRRTFAGGTRLAQAATLNDAHKERLRALGYMK